MPAAFVSSSVPAMGFGPGKVFFDPWLVPTIFQAWKVYIGARSFSDAYIVLILLVAPQAFMACFPGINSVNGGGLI